MSKRVFKRSLYDVVSVWNQMLAIISILNIITLLVNLFIYNSKIVLIICYVVDAFLVLFIVTELVIIRHNDKILKQFYLSDSEIAIFSRSK